MNYLPQDLTKETKDEIIKRVKAEVKEKKFSRIEKHSRKVLNYVMPKAKTPFNEVKQIALCIAEDRRYIVTELNNEGDYEIRKSGKNWVERNTSWWDVLKYGIGFGLGLLTNYLTNP